MTEWTKNKERNAAIKELRRQGKSVREIEVQLNCPRSVVSYHCRGTERLPQVVNAVPSGETIKERWSKRREVIRAEALAEWPKIQTDPELMLLLGIYWGEGSKGHVRVTNNNPSLIQTIYQGLRRLTAVQAVATIIYYKSHNPKICEVFWHKALPGADIRLRLNTDTRSKTKWCPRCPYGRCELVMHEYRLYWRLKTWLDCLQGALV